MSKTIDQIVTDVRVCIDEIGKNDSGFVGDTDDSEMDTIIKSKIIDAANFVYGNCDINLLGNSNLVVEDEADENFSSSNVLAFTFGDEMLRFVQARLSSWVKPETETISAEDSEFASVLDEFVGATYQKPAVLQYRDYSEEENKTVTVIALVGRKANDEDEVGRVWYIQRFSNTSSEELDIADQVYRAVVYYCAGLTLLTFNETTRSQEMLEMAITLMGATTTNKQQ